MIKIASDYMKQQILDKIRDKLLNGINSQAEVVYLLAEIRKVLTLIRGEGAKCTLEFFCDCVLHGELSYKSSAKFFLDRFEPYVKPALEAIEIAREIKKYNKSFFIFDEMKNELQSFLVSNNLPTTLVDDSKSWREFSRNLLEVLEECSVISSGHKIDKISLVKDKNGYNCYRLHLKGRRDIVKIKVKFKH